MTSQTTTRAWRRCATGALGAAVLAVLVVAPASAQSTCGPGRTPVVDRDTGEISCVLVETSPNGPSPDPVDGPGDGGNDAWRPPPGWVLVDYRVEAYEDDGTPCIMIRYEWMPEGEAADFRTGANYSWFRWYDRLTADGSTMDDCTGQDATPALDPEMVRQMIVSQLPLPDPAIEPGRAITGLRSYLDIGAPTTFADSISGDVLPVVIDLQATAEYRVDWGDGTVETFSSSGGPYPDGDVTHVYTTAGDVTVTVTPVWTVSWEGGGFSATFSADLVPATVDLPIGEVRAVRTD